MTTAILLDKPYTTAWENMSSSPALDDEVPELGFDNDYNDDNDDWEEAMAVKVGELTTTQDARSVVLIRDHVLELPELYLSVCVLGPPEDTKGFSQLFVRAECTGTDNIEDADLVVFSGGPDVNPAYYGEEPVSSFCGNDERDYADIVKYLECYEQGIPMLGICRGAQFLAVMNDGKLAQDVDNHVGDHPMWAIKDKSMLEHVSSVHHQAVLHTEGMEVLGHSYKSTSRWLNPETHLTKPNAIYAPDIEAYFIRESCCLGIQGHPEYRGYSAFAKWTLEQINNYVILNPDLDWDETTKRRRLRPEFLKERELRYSKKQERPLLTLVKEAK